MASARQLLVRRLPARVTIAHKLAFILTILIASGMVLLGLVIHNSQKRLLDNQMNDFAKTVVHQLSESSKELILSDDTLSLMVLISSLTANQNTLGVVIYNESGKVLASSGMTPPNDILGLYRTAKKIDQTNFSVEWRNTDESGANIEVISYIAPVTFQNLYIGHSLVTFSKASLGQAASATIQAIVLATVFMILLGIITAYFIGQRLSQPIYSLMDASKAIDAGNYDFRINEKRNDEIGYLIDSFNNMANGLLQKSQVENAFSRFVSSKVAKQIMNNLDQVQLGGKHVNATAVFADIVGFTAISEKLPPANVAALLNEYFSYITTVCRLYHGTIDKFMGDCAMLIFGAPDEDPDHKFNAISCAVMIQRLVHTLNIERAIDGQMPIHFRIGINSGPMLAGNMGSNEHMQYTVVGDTVNLASRLHTVAEPGQIVISDELVKDPDVQWRIIAHRHQSIKLRGISNPVTTYVVTDVKHDYSKTIDSQVSEIIAHQIVA
ncbi:MAG: HAMP domain-containing protein [Gammaproteobacteria bacterium]|nr:HAMP domain-containing protein [Gammaproteobacteria bacterium]MDH5651078.1 HAMP domain-containing protein [Gammaproteobacteria bacterium]